MSDNQGKDGEMRFAIIIAGVAIKENGIDFTRPTKTNQPDLGLDYSVHGSVQTLVSLCKTGTGENLEAIGNLLGDPERKIEARFDIKTTEEKLAGDTVDKFASDVKNHPNTKLHILGGGSGLTPAAAQKFVDHQANFSKSGKALVYIPNQGLVRLANEVRGEILTALAGPTGKAPDTSGNEEK